MVSPCTVGWVSESTTIKENDVRPVCLLWESSTQGFDQYLSVFTISNREVTSSSVMSLTDVVAKKTIGFGNIVHDVKFNCHVREMQRGVPGRGVNELRVLTGSVGIVAGKAYMGLDARNS